jgi:hypothetical protein
VQKANGDTYSAYFHKLRKHYTLVNVDGPEERFEFDGYGTAVTPTDKGYGAAESYSKKYALRSLFLIETDRRRRGEREHRDAAGEGEHRGAGASTEAGGRRRAARDPDHRAPRGGGDPRRGVARSREPVARPRHDQ